MKTSLHQFTFNSQSDDHALVLDAIDELTAVLAAVFQLKMAELQGGVQGVGLPERRPWSETAVRLTGVCV